MRKVLFLCMFFSVYVVFTKAQTPFDVKTIKEKVTTESRVVKNAMSFSGMLRFPKSNKTFNFLTDTSKTKNNNLVNLINKEIDEGQTETSVLNQYSGGIVINDNAANLFPTINGNILTYRLGIYTSKTTEKTTYLPLSIISKVSGNSNNNSGTVNDATSFFGAPLTFRLSPVIANLPVGKENNLIIGMIHDARLISIADTSTSKAEAGFGYYGAFGLTYFGKGEVVENSGSNTYSGNWSFSALAYYFTSGGKFTKAVFGNYENKSLGGVELMLKFNTSQKENSKFNLFISGNYGLTEKAPNYNSWQLRIGVGN